MIDYIKNFWQENVVIGLILLVGGFCETFVSVQMANLLDALIAFDFSGLQTTFWVICPLFLSHFFFTSPHCKNKSS